MTETLDSLEERVLEVVALLVSQGYSVHDLLDYEDGVTPVQLFALQAAAARLAILRRKAETETLLVAIGSVFKPQIVKDHFRGLDEQLGQLVSAEVATPQATRLQPSVEAAQRSVRNLEKLRAILN